MRTFLSSVGTRTRAFFRKRFAKVREINRRYREPRIQTKGFVGFALILLRFYLIFLIGLLIYKFISIVLHPSSL